MQQTLHKKQQINSSRCNYKDGFSKLFFFSTQSISTLFKNKLHTNCFDYSLQNTDNGFQMLITAPQSTGFMLQL